MEIPPPDVVLIRIRALPGGASLLDALDLSGPPVHLVGGAVRDLLLGRTPRELDLVVEGDVTPVATRLGSEIRSHDRFGTATVTVDGRTLDLARSRWESYARPGALPDVEPAALAEDLKRRDFTVNTGAIALTGPERSRFVSDPRLPADLEAGVLRVLHDASFIDDPTRLLRLARYMGRLSFSAEPHTRTLVDDAVLSDALSTVSEARIGTELRLLAAEPDPLAALAALHELGLDAPLGLAGDPTTIERARRALALLPAGERPDRLVLAAALQRQAGTDAPGALRAALDRWGFEAADREAILAAATGTTQLARALEAAASPSEIAAAAHHAPAELVALAGALGPGPAARQWLEQLRHVGLEITGEDLLAAGVPQGEGIGRGLRAALREKLDARVTSRDEELAAAVRAAAPSQ